MAYTFISPHASSERETRSGLARLAVLLVALLAPGAGHAAAQSERDPAALLSASRLQLAAGRPDAALEILERAARVDMAAADRVRMWRLRARAERARGIYTRAQHALEQALALARSGGLEALHRWVLIELGDLELLRGRHRPAMVNLDQAVALATAAADAQGLGQALLNRASVHLAMGGRNEAAADLARSLEAAVRARDWSTAAKARLNGLRTGTGAPGDALQVLKAAAGDAARVDDDSERLQLLLAMGGQAVTAAGADGGGANGPGGALAHRLLSDAVQLARRLDNERARSQALGQLAGLYESAERHADAARLAESALFFARSSGATELVYRWEWQIGRIFKAQGKYPAALVHYRQAAVELSQLRGHLEVGRRLASDPFRDVLVPVYLGLADLLMRTAAPDESPDGQQQRLREARQAVEQLKAAELEDYFQDGCVTALQSRITPLEDVDASTAVLYHIAFEDRLEILISSGGTMSVVRVPVGADELVGLTRELRTQLERISVRSGFVRPAARLYDYMVRPVESLLVERGVKTLVFVPYGDFLLVPPAALFDGRQFLIEKFALAITPGLNLTDPKPLSSRPAQVLVSGLSQSRQGFPALPEVTEEVFRINRRFGGNALLDEAFTSAAVQSSLKERPYTILHFATHAQFSEDPRKTFLLTYDGRLSMDELDTLVRQGEFRDQPVELLTLSACETAAGDYRSVLGLAGVGIKAGARSALASFWPVSDQAAGQLVESFYEHLSGEPAVSKAMALQNAQREMLESPQFWHPGFWSVFVLIGNWL